MVFVAVAVLVLALVVAAGKQGTIVVERVAFSATTVQDGKTSHPPPYLLTSIAETSADGTLRRSFTSASVTRPGHQQVIVGATAELYDPADNTLYVTTEQAERRAVIAQTRSTEPKGSHVAVGSTQLAAASYSSATEQYVPGSDEHLRTATARRALRAGGPRDDRRTRCAQTLADTRQRIFDPAQYRAL
jgi:hypothetical protein